MKMIKGNKKQNFVAQKNISFYFVYSLFFYIILVGFTTSVYAQSDVYLSIRAGGSGLIGIGLGGFQAADDTSGTYTGDFSKILSVKNALVDDLNNSALFKVNTLSDSLKAINGGLFAQWKATGAKYFLFGETGKNGNSIIINVIDLNTALTILNEEYLIFDDRPWYTAHVIVDDMIEFLTGLRGSLASQIAYIYPYREDSNEIYIINADGKSRRQLTYSKTLNISPYWSPDGDHLIFSSLHQDNWQLMMVNLNTGQTQNISSWSGLNTSPTWSPLNPDIIAFSSNRDGNSEIYSCRTDGKNIRRLTNHFRIDSAPSYSPDGKQIAFSSDRTGQPMIYIMNSDGSNVHRLTSRLNAYEDSPCWSPRGDRIAFVVLFDRSFDIAICSPSGDDTVIITSGEGSNENPRWSPDGLRIVFSSTRLGGKNLFIMNWDGSNVRPITKDGKSFSPAWSPASSGNDIRASSKR